MKAIRVVALVAAGANVVFGSICDDLNKMRAVVRNMEGDSAKMQGLDNVDKSLKDECLTLGCDFAGNTCSEPAACKEDNTKVLKYLNNDINVIASRTPISPETASLCSTDPDCTAIYRLTLEEKFTTGQCNSYGADIGAVPPHGSNQVPCAEIMPGTFAKVKDELRDYTKHPYPDDAVRQRAATSKGGNTALFEDSDRCWVNNMCAYPKGFLSDSIHKNKNVCIYVSGAADRWVEIMAASKDGSNGGSFCVEDWKRTDSEQADRACTKEGDLYECRESGNTQFGDSMKIKFFAADNYDDGNIQFYWRVVASKLPAGGTGIEGEEKDAEDWCQASRDGADYPSSMMNPYPDGYDAPRVMDKVEDAAAMTLPTVITMVAVVAAVLC